MTGRIIKGIGGFYYVRTDDGIYECKARGGFRKDGISPLVGDFVKLEQNEDKDVKTGFILEIVPRKNILDRPRVANVDQLVLVFSSTVPKPSYEVLNRYLAVVSETNLPVFLIVTKTDLALSKDIEEIRQSFFGTNYPIGFCSSKSGEGVPAVREALSGKISVFAGPSGVGKSSLLNLLLEKQAMEVGTLSKKIDRGKNTTRHAEMFCIGTDTYLIDTPGFSSVDYDFLQKENLAFCFEEFIPYLPNCRYSSCTHRKEEGCAVRKAVEDGRISRIRYNSYTDMFDYLNMLRRY